MVECPKSDAIHEGLEGALGKSSSGNPVGLAAARSKRVGAVASKATAGCTGMIHMGMMGVAVVQTSPDLAESPEERMGRLHMSKMVEG